MKDFKARPGGALSAWFINHSAGQRAARKRPAVSTERIEYDQRLQRAWEACGCQICTEKFSALSREGGGDVVSARERYVRAARSQGRCTRRGYTLAVKP